MKKSVSLLLTCALVLSSVLCVSAGELPECMATLTIDMITHCEDPHNPLNFTFTLPDTYDGITVFAAFYADDKLTRLENLNTLYEKQENSISYKVTFDESDDFPLTPDEIKLFTWENGSIKPLAKTGNILEDTKIVEYANYNTLQYIVKPLLGQYTPDDVAQTTPNVISKLKSKILNPSKCPDVMNLISEIETCANIAYNNKDKILLTSEGTKRLLSLNFDNLVNLSSTIKADDEQQDILLAAYEALTERQKKPFTFLITFFDLELPI